MRLRNRHGTPVDPIPFLVVAVLAFLLCFSFGPPYAGAFGASLAVALACSALAFLAATAVAFYRLVWTVDPALRAEIPADQRFAQLLYAGVAFALLLVLLILPLL